MDGQRGIGREVGIERRRDRAEAWDAGYLAHGEALAANGCGDALERRVDRRVAQRGHGDVEALLQPRDHQRRRIGSTGIPGVVLAGHREGNPDHLMAGQIDIRAHDAQRERGACASAGSHNHPTRLDGSNRLERDELRIPRAHAHAV